MSDDQPLEVHRPFVRDLNHEVSGTYGYGGMAVLVVLGLYVSGVFWWNVHAQPAAWMGAVVLFLSALKGLSMVINRRKSRAQTRLLAYCITNEVESSDLREYFVQDDMYPFFAAIVDDTKIKKRA